MTRCLVRVSERRSASADAYAGDRPSFPKRWRRKEAAAVGVGFRSAFYGKGGTAEKLGWF